MFQQFTCFRHQYTLIRVQYELLATSFLNTNQFYMTICMKNIGDLTFFSVQACMYELLLTNYQSQINNIVGMMKCSLQRQHSCFAFRVHESRMAIFSELPSCTSTCFSAITIASSMTPSVIISPPCSVPVAVSPRCLLLVSYRIDGQ